MACGAGLGVNAGAVGLRPAGCADASSGSSRMGCNLFKGCDSLCLAAVAEVGPWC